VDPRITQGPDTSRSRTTITRLARPEQRHRAALARGITPVIPRKANSKERGRFFP
jgi:hypothetical protein